MEHDLHHRVKGVIALNQVAINSDTTTDGVIIDTLGFESLEYFTTSGTITDGDYAFLLEEDDVIGFGSSTPVGPDEILGSTVGFVASEDLIVKRVGSLGKKRFQRLSIVSTSNGGTGLDTIGTVAVLSDAYVNPVADQ